ncbi:hypothetical protein JL722_4730 [Aureococcus anophagefferens]|nr:hypothetical protein JL722_4730 [Aureococcus anophagefferens]
MAALEASPMATDSTLPGTLTCVASLAGHSERVWHAAWSPDGSLLASCSSDRCVKIWHCAGGAWGLVSTLDDAHERTVRKCDWSPCGRYLAAVSFDGTCCVWRRVDDDGGGGGGGGPLEWEIIATLEGHENEVKGAAWNASATLLATCGRDKSVWLWEFGDDEGFELASASRPRRRRQGRVLRRLLAAPGRRPAGELLLRRFDQALGRRRRRLELPRDAGRLGSTVWDLRFVAAPDGSRRLVSCGADRVLRLWVEGEPHAWTVGAALENAHGRCVYSCDAVGPDPTTRVASGGGDDRVSVYGLGAGFARLADAPKAHDGDVNPVRWSPADATLLATAGDDALVKIWKFVTA